MSDIRIEHVRLSFANLLKPTKFSESDEPRFRTDLLIPKDDPQVKVIKRAMLEAANERWGEKGKQQLQVLLGKEKTFLRDGDEKVSGDGEALDGYPGHYYLRASNAVKPLLLDRNEEELDPLKGSKDTPYSGCYVHVILNVWAQDSHNTRRVNAKLLGVMFHEDGESFGSGPQRADKSAFAGLAETASDSDGSFDDDDLEGL